MYNLLSEQEINDIVIKLQSNPQISHENIYDMMIGIIASKSHLGSFLLLLDDDRFELAKSIQSLITGCVDADNLEIIKLLLKRCQDKNIMVNENILILAINAKKLDIIKYLVFDYKIDPSIGNNAAIKFFSSDGYFELASFILNDSRVDPSASDDYAIIDASRNGHAEIVKLLLSDARVDPAASSDMAIRCASRNGNTEIVKLLLTDPRVNPSGSNNDAIEEASKFGHHEVVKLLLTDSRVNPTTNNYYALNNSSINGHIKVVKLLISDKRIDPSFNNNRAIIRSIETNHIDIAKLLIGRCKTKLTQDSNVYELAKSLNLEEIMDLIMKYVEIISEFNKDNINKIKNLMLKNNIVEIDMRSGTNVKFNVCLPTNCINQDTSELSLIVDSMRYQNITKITIKNDEIELTLS